MSSVFRGRSGNIFLPDILILKYLCKQESQELKCHEGSNFYCFVVDGSFFFFPHKIISSEPEILAGPE